MSVRKPIIMDHDFTGYNPRSRDFVARCQTELCVEVGGLTWWPEYHFFRDRYQDARGDWINGPLDLSIADGWLNSSVGARRREFSGLNAIDLEGKFPLQAALEGDRTAIDAFRGVLQWVKDNMGGRRGLYAPRLPSREHTTYALKVDAWRNLMRRLDDLVDIWLPPLYTQDGVREADRFGQMLDLAAEFGKPAWPYLDWPQCYTIRQYRDDLSAVLEGRTITHALAWDRRLIR